MTAAHLQCWTESDQSAVRDQLCRILGSGPFVHSKRRQQFLVYIVNETLAGRGDRLKGYNIAVEVFDRPENFDPNVDPVVRIEAGKLRDRLREYYEADGQQDPVRIELPKGCYTPHIEIRQDVTSAPRPNVFEVRASDPQPDAMPALDKAAEPGPTARLPAYTHFSRSQLVLLIGALFLIVVAITWGLAGPNVRPSQSGKPSIAVLPFDNLGQDARWERFAEGITEDIISDLARFRNLDVIARNSTAVYKKKPVDVRQIGRNLNVRYVLEGSIQPTGERIRVAAQLVEAASGSHVWTERFDRPVEDLFAVQTEVTQRIAATLGGYQGAIEEAERYHVRRKPPASLTAYDIYLLAMDMKHDVTKESLIAAEGLFRKALELDPQLARAYVGLTDVYFYMIDLGFTASVEETKSKMIEAAERAVQLDPNDGKTHLALGYANLVHGKLEQASAEIDRAEALAPSDADVLLIIAWSVPGLGQSERAVSLAERVLTLNPHYPRWYNQGLSYVYFFGEQFDKSLKYRLLVKEPYALDYAFIAMAYAHLGRESDAKAAAASVMRSDPTWIAERYLSEGGGYPEKEAELFVDSARRAGLPDCIRSNLIEDNPNIVRVKSCDLQRAKTQE